MASKSASGLQIPILAFMGGSLMILSAVRGQSVIDILAGVKSDPTNPKGHSFVDVNTNAGTPNSAAPDQQVVGSHAGSVNGAIPGSPVAGQSPHASTHQTAGLPGYPAFDYMAPAGTPCLAPASGVIFKLSGKDPKLGGAPGGPLGYSIYLRGTNGTSYFMTHLDKVSVKVGQKVTQGQQIAVVANGPASWSSPHVHMGVHK